MAKKDFIKHLQELHAEAEQLGKNDLQYIGVAKVLKQQLVKLDAFHTDKPIPRPKGFLQEDVPTEEEKAKLSAKENKATKPALNEKKEIEKEENRDKSSELMTKIAKLTAIQMEKDYGLAKLKVIANGINQSDDKAGIEIVDDVKVLSKSIFEYFHNKEEEAAK